MKLLNHEARYLGADGCRGGWITAVLDHGELHLERYQSVEEVTAAWPEFDAFLIDMVIGLRSNAAQLRPDDLAKKELGPRASTVFPVPCRQAVCRVAWRIDARRGRETKTQNANMIFAG